MHVHWSSLDWDIEFTGVFTEIKQSKTHKSKIIAYVAGANRHLCFFLNTADYLATRTLPIYDPAATDWLIPELQVTNSPGTTLDNFIKALLPGVGLLQSSRRSPVS